MCPIGDPLQLTCTASVQFIRWSIFRVINDQGTPSEITNSVLIDNSDDNQMKSRERSGCHYIHFHENFCSIARSFTSIWSLHFPLHDSVNFSLDGAIVRCLDVANPIMTLASTNIQIVAIGE